MESRLFPVKQVFFEKEIEPIIEKNYIWKGRPPKISHYKVFCAIMYVLRTEIPWRDLPKCYGCWHTIYQRFKRGSEKGIWWKLLMLLQQNKKLLINIVITDSTTFKLHRHGGGLKGGCKAKETVAEELTADIVGCDVIQDRGYDSNKNRQNLESQNNVTIIPGRKNRKTEIVYDREKYKLRGTIERFFGKIKENRRLAVRYEKDDLSFLSFISLAAIKLHLC